MELDQHMHFVEVAVSCMKFGVQPLVPHKSRVQQEKVLPVEVYRSFEEQLLGPRKNLVELVVVDRKMFVELLLVLHMNLVELRKQMLVVSYKMFVELQLVLHRNLEEHCNQIVVLLLALVVPCTLVFAVV